MGSGSVLVVGHAHLDVGHHARAADGFEAQHIVHHVAVVDLAPHPAGLVGSGEADEVIGGGLVGEALAVAIHLHEGLAADILLEDASAEYGAFAFALVAGIHARSHGPTVEDHGGGVLVFRGSGPQPRLDAVACASGIEAGGGAAGYSGGLQGGHHHGVGRVAARGEQGVFSIDLLIPSLVSKIAPVTLPSA